MEIKKTTEHRSSAIKIIAENDGQEIGRVYLYLLYNDLHAEPFGLVEDLFVTEEYRHRGIGGQLMSEAIVEAKYQACYKVLATSRHGRDEIHTWYKKLGFKNHGVEFRMDF